MDPSSILGAIYSQEFQAGFFAGEGLILPAQATDFWDQETSHSTTQLLYSPVQSQDLKSRWSFDDPDIVRITEVQPYMNLSPGSHTDIPNQSFQLSSVNPVVPLVSTAESFMPFSSATASLTHQVKLTYTETNYTYVEGSGGHPLIHVNGYKFYKANTRKKATIWTCAGKTKYKCKKRLRQTATAVMISDGDHTHPGDKMQTGVDLFVESIRKRVCTELNSSIKDIYDSQAKLYLTSGTETKAILEAAPTSEFIMSSMKRARRKVLPIIPQTREGIDFNSCNLDKHILIEDGDTDKIVVVGTPELFQHVCTSELLHMDGTFKSAPNLYAQLFIVHGIAHEMLWPLLFCLLPGKTQALYKRLFCLLAAYAKRNGLVLSPRCVHIDFERAIVNSVLTVFPESTVKGCFFHFSQCIFRRIKKVGLGPDYNILGSTCRAILRRLFYIPFLPVEDMAITFEQVADESKWAEQQSTLRPDQIIKLREIMSYYRKNWIREMRLERYNVWSVTVRTNNKAEAFNNNLNKKVKPHPNVYALVRFLGEDQNVNTEIGIMQAAKGTKVCKQRRSYRVRDELIEEAKEWLREEVYTPLEYVDRISLLYDQKYRDQLLRDQQEEQHKERTTQGPAATPMPAAVRRKGQLGQFCRLSVPRPRIGKSLPHRSPRQHQPESKRQPEQPSVRKKTSKVENVVVQKRETSYCKDTRKRPANDIAFDEPSRKKPKMVDVSTSSCAHRQINESMSSNKCKTREFGLGTWSRNTSKRKRTPFIETCAMPDTLVPATPPWLKLKRKLAEKKKLQGTHPAKSDPIPLVRNQKQPMPKKISLEEALHLVLCDDD